MNIQILNLDPSKKYAIGEEGGKFIMFELVPMFDLSGISPPAVQGMNWTGYSDSNGQPLYVGDDVKVYSNGKYTEVSKITDFTDDYGHIGIMGWATHPLESMLTNYKVIKVS